MSDDYEPLERQLGYVFHDVAVLERALTHTSFLNENPRAAAGGRRDNQRLEFLGDAVLDLAIGQLLMEAFPEHSEGDLSKLRAQIVSEQGLCEAAQRIDLGQWLFLGRGEEHTGGRRKPSLLADACEAVIAAVFLDAGYEAARDVVRRLFGERALAAGAVGPADHKTLLQERVQGRLRLHPRYATVATAGPEHEKTFEVALFIGEREYARGFGRSKKEAEQRAAEQALRALDAEGIT